MGPPLGLFLNHLFPIHISPLKTRPKQDSDKRWTIVDLGWPRQQSGYTGISKHKYLDTYFKLQYPSIDNITDTLVKLGPEAMLYKVDICRTFRHIRINPRDIDLLGLKYKNLFLGVTLQFGFCHR